jgi:serine phosphatase RsbU (regulator of sigma subunit)
MRFRKLLAEKNLLEEKVIERTREIQSQKTEIEKQRDMIEQKNSNITSSITYAGKIQNAIFPPLELLDALLPENFLFHLPKDIVSGDFYWVAERDNKVIFAVADCTGHGVPGAFMSLLGITLLNEIVNVHGIIVPDQIVTNLREKVVHSLLQSRKGYTTTDGMDIAVCVLDFQQKKLQYAGAMNDLVYVRNGKLNVLKADHMDVSPADFNKEKFALRELDYISGDMIYLFSDGYQDQFGGDFDKKFLRPHFYNRLFEMSALPVKSQKDFLEKKLQDWMGDRTQTDDITVLGIRL